MNIVVCIKQVPDTTDVKINPQTNTLMRDGVRSIINPFDMFAIEEALRIREKVGGCVTTLTMGPPQAKAALEDVIAMGADNAILLSHHAFAGSDTLATSFVLSQAIKKIGTFDIIICGKQASDGDTAQVGPGIAVHLGIPQATFVRKIRTIENGIIVAERMSDLGHDVIELYTPCLITVVKEINTPRYATFSGKVRAKKSKIPVWGPSDIGCDEKQVGLDGSPTCVEKIFAPPAKKGCTPLSATEDNILKTATNVREFIDSMSNPKSEFRNPKQIQNSNV